jgi:hypothetical protein
MSAETAPKIETHAHPPGEFQQPVPAQDGIE